MTIRALQEKSDAQQYLMNVENSQKQLTFNEIADQQGKSREQLILNDARAEDAFERQDRNRHRRLKWIGPRDCERLCQRGRQGHRCCAHSCRARWWHAGG